MIKNLLSGPLAAIGAYLIWGFIPLFWKLLNHFSPIQILLFRTIWTAVFFLLLGLMTSKNLKWEQISFKNLLMIFLSSLFLGANWFIFIYAVNSNQITEASLGYFLNPIVNILIGVLILKEKLSKSQMIALTLALLSTGILSVQEDSIPWIALVLALTFGFYGLLRKKIAMPLWKTSFIESVVLIFPVLYLNQYYLPDFNLISIQDHLLLATSGVVTGLPLLFFAFATKQMNLSQLGFFQYLSPSIQFALGVFVFNEILGPHKLVAFSLVWLGLIIVGAKKLRSPSRVG